MTSSSSKLKKSEIPDCRVERCILICLGGVYQKVNKAIPAGTRASLLRPYVSGKFQREHVEVCPESSRLL